MSAAVVEGVLVSLQEIRSFIVRCMQKVGTKHSHAQALADVLVAADHRGHFSHGLNRLEMYVRDIETKICASDCEPVVTKETVAVAHVDGRNLLGPVVGNFCMDLALEKAKNVGIGSVVAKGSNHFGIVGWYTERAVKRGMIGMAFTNTSPIMVPTRAKGAAIGTNPLSVAAPAKGDDYFNLDMAATAVALGKLEVQRRKGESIPHGWAVDGEGRETTDPDAAIKRGALQPLGGAELTSGYKGYGLALMGEIFCGILADANYGPNIRKWMDTTRVADLGQCFVAIDPDAFALGFCDRMSDLLDTCRNLPSVEEDKEVLVPGDPERKRMQENDEAGGVTYHVNQIKSCNELAAKLGIEPMKTNPQIV